MEDVKRQNHGAALSMAMEIMKVKREPVTAANVIADAREFYKYLNEVSQDAKETDR